VECIHLGADLPAGGPSDVDDAVRADRVRDDLDDLGVVLDVLDRGERLVLLPGDQSRLTLGDACSEYIPQAPAEVREQIVGLVGGQRLLAEALVGQLQDIRAQLIAERNVAVRAPVALALVVLEQFLECVLHLCHCSPLPTMFRGSLAGGAQSGTTRRGRRCPSLQPGY
jgi:hypothetical protein